MSQVVQCTCCVPGCTKRVNLSRLRLAYGPLDVTEGLCTRHLAMAARDRIILFRAARLGLIACQGLAEIVLFIQAWEALKSSAIERTRGGMA